MSLFEDMIMRPDPDERGVISGIVTGTVRENYNQDHPGQIKVELFLGESGRNVTGWVSVMTPYAGADHGYYSLPEVGSEVVVAFNMGDRNRPVVLGCLWSDQNKLPKGAATEKNTTKTFVTKCGAEITIDETENKEKITVKTPKGKGIEFDEEKDSITLHDKDNKNSIVIDSGKGTITINADKKLVFKAGGSETAVFDGTNKASIKSTTIELNANKDFKAKAQTTNLEGTAVTVKGSSSLQVTSSGSTQVKGTIVKIN